MVSRNCRRQDRGAKWVIGRHRSGWLVIPIQHICLITDIFTHIDPHYCPIRCTTSTMLPAATPSCVDPQSSPLSNDTTACHNINFTAALSPTAVDSYAVASPTSASLATKMYGSGVQFSFCVGAEVARHAIVEDGEAVLCRVMCCVVERGNNLLDPIHNRILFLYLCLEWLLEVLLSHFLHPCFKYCGMEVVVARQSATLERPMLYKPQLILMSMLEGGGTSNRVYEGDVGHDFLPSTSFPFSLSLSLSLSLLETKKLSRTYGERVTSSVVVSERGFEAAAVPYTADTHTHTLFLSLPPFFSPSLFGSHLDDFSLLSRRACAEVLPYRYGPLHSPSLVLCNIYMKPRGATPSSPTNQPTGDYNHNEPASPPSVVEVAAIPVAGPQAKADDPYTTTSHETLSEEGPIRSSISYPSSLNPKRRKMEVEVEMVTKRYHKGSRELFILINFLLVRSLFSRRASVLDSLYYNVSKNSFFFVFVFTFLDDPDHTWSRVEMRYGKESESPKFFCLFSLSYTINFGIQVPYATSNLYTVVHHLVSLSPLSLSLSPSPSLPLSFYLCIHRHPAHPPFSLHKRAQLFLSVIFLVVPLNNSKRIVVRLHKIHSHLLHAEISL
eukprot:gene9427-6615_t